MCSAECCRINLIVIHLLKGRQNTNTFSGCGKSHLLLGSIGCEWQRKSAGIVSSRVLPGNNPAYKSHYRSRGKNGEKRPRGAMPGRSCCSRLPLAWIGSCPWFRKGPEGPRDRPGWCQMAPVRNGVHVHGSLETFVFTFLKAEI